MKLFISSSVYLSLQKKRIKKWLKTRLKKRKKRLHKISKLSTLLIVTCDWVTFSNLLLNRVFYFLLRLFFSPPPSLSLRLWFIHTTCCTMGALFAKWDSLNGDLYFQDYICIQLQMIWRGGRRGSRFNTLPLSMNNSIIWIKWTPGAVGKALRRAVDPLPLPTSLFPSLSLSVPPSLQFHSPSTKCHTLVTLVSLRQKLALSWKAKGWKRRRKKKSWRRREGEREQGEERERERERNSYQSPLRFWAKSFESAV